MVGFPVLMLLIYGAPDWPKALARLAGLAMFSDNFVAWIDGYNKAIRYSAHLWTLSFEFQVYLFIPAAFLAWKAMGSRAFLILLGSILLLAIALRTTFSLVGAKHPVIWVTPFLRPDSVILGLALVVVRPRWHWGYSAAAGAMGLALFLSIGVPWSGPLPGAASYLVLAVTAAAIVDAALRSPIKDVTKKTGPIVRLGRISFGLYVYHLVAIWATARWIAWIWQPLTPKESVADYLILLTATLAVTIAFSAASYLLVERRFEKAKLRFTVVSGRPVGAAA